MHYITIQVLVLRIDIYSYVCQRHRALATYCASKLISRLKRSYALTTLATRIMHWSLMHWLRGADFCRVTLITYPQTHITHTRQAANTIAQWENKKIYIMEIPQSPTECSLLNSISGATDYCTLYTVQYTLVYTVFVDHWIEYILKP